MLAILVPCPELFDFRNMLDSIELIGHPWPGSFFTWSNKRPVGHIAGRLDRTLINSNWPLTFSNFVLDFLNLVISNHSTSLTLVAPSTHRPNVPFRYFKLLG